MVAEILAIGTELLLGSIVNTNARFLSRKLAENAIQVYRHGTVGDNVGRILEELERALRRSDLVITSGGLGPTEDDVTKRAIAAFIRKPLVLHGPTYRRLRQRLKGHTGVVPRLLKWQCHLPQGARVIPNSVGTAPGLLCRVPNGKTPQWILALPGPPRELEPMFIRHALSLLLKAAPRSRGHFIIRSLRLSGLTEAQAAQKVTDLLKLKPPATVGIYAKPSEVELKIMVKDASLQTARRKAKRLEQIIRSRFKEKVYGADESSLAGVVGDLLRKKRKTLSVAESCTGGLCSSLITDCPGSSDYFIGGLVAYHHRLKTGFLGIGPRILKTQGAVSAASARCLAAQIRKRFGTDYGIGITGIAGPSGGSAQKPVGLAYLAVAGPRGVKTEKNLFRGNRTLIKLRAAHRALDKLRLELLSRGSSSAG